MASFSVAIGDHKDLRYNLGSAFAGLGIMTARTLMTRSGVTFLRFPLMRGGNLLITGTASSASGRFRLFTSLAESAIVSAIELGGGISGVECREELKHILTCAKERPGKWDGSRMLVFVDGLESLLAGLRSETDRSAVIDMVGELLETGPGNGIHVIMNQTISDAGINAKTLSLISDGFGMVVHGRLGVVDGTLLLGSGQAKDWTGRGTALRIVYRVPGYPRRTEKISV